MTTIALAENSIQLVPDATLLVHIVVILVMVWILNRTLFRPVNEVLEDRERRTSGARTETSRLESDIHEKLRRYEKGIRDARAASYRLLEQERSVLLRQREQELALASERMRLVAAGEKAEIDGQAKEARIELAIESEKMAAQIGTQVLGRSVN
jgi:F-type H+-transporting ATPase subunit b